MREKFQISLQLLDECERCGSFDCEEIFEYIRSDWGTTFNWSKILCHNCGWEKDGCD
jgi:hypothetical protein